MTKKKTSNLSNGISSIETDAKRVMFQDTTEFEAHINARKILKNALKRVRECSTFDEHMDARYGRPGSETRRLFVAKARAFLASEIYESSAITVDPEVLGRTPVFSGTRVPIQNLIDYLKTEESSESFLEDFEGVTELQIKRIVRSITRFPD